MGHWGILSSTNEVLVSMEAAPDSRGDILGNVHGERSDSVHLRLATSTAARGSGYRPVVSNHLETQRRRIWRSVLFPF